MYKIDDLDRKNTKNLWMRSITVYCPKPLLKEGNLPVTVSVDKSKRFKKAGSEEVDKVRAAMYGIEVPNLAGGTAVMNTNHHLSKPVLIGEIQQDGQFDIVWQTEGEVKGDAWTDFLPESKVLISDWTAPIHCGNYNTITKTCGGPALASEE